MTRCIGIDFDNTIVNYERVFIEAAFDRQLLPAGFIGDKERIRDTIRELPNGNWKWIELQAQVYGREIQRAEPFPGLRAFLSKAAAAGSRLCVISHKGRFAAADPGGVDLHEAARGWLRSNGFLAPDGPFALDSVYFEADRSAKIARIAACGCTDFIDDLLDILDDPAFPQHVRRFHFVAKRDGPRLSDAPWRDIADELFAH